MKRCDCRISLKSVGGINRHVKEAEFYRTLLSRGERGERVFDIWHNEVGPHWNSSRCQCCERLRGFSLRNCLPNYHTVLFSKYAVTFSQNCVPRGNGFAVLFGYRVTRRARIVA